MQVQDQHGQRIHFCKAQDGTRIAFATTGVGPPVVRAAHYLSHLQFDVESPVWHHWIRELSRYNHYIRYDERGCGLSDWNVSDFTFEAWVSDLETVVDSLNLNKFTLLGVSQGGPVSIAYTARHPGRVDKLVLYGTYALGYAKRKRTQEDKELGEKRRLMHKLMELGWGQDNPAFRQLFTSLFIPDAGPEQMRWFNELQRVSCPPQNALKFDDVNSNIDVTDLLEEIDVPTLILHAREDAIVPFDQGRLLATQIRGARFVPFEGRNHILLENEPAWPIFLREIRQFQGVSPQDQVFTKQVITDRLPEHELSETKKLIVQTDEIALARFSVVGNYLRYQAEVRNSLKDWKQKIVMGLRSPSNGENYLVWAPPGSGKTYFVQELANSLKDTVSYEELNLAQLSENEFRSKLDQLSSIRQSSLCLVDEVDAKPGQSWPYEALLPGLERGRGGRVSFVLAGSSTSEMQEMKQRIMTRPKGPDLLNRISSGNEFVIPTLSQGDKFVLGLGQFRQAGKKRAHPVNEVEKLALYYVCITPRLSNPRQFREFTNQAVQRLPQGEDRVKYDHLFNAGDPENKEFWERTKTVREELVGQFVSVRD